jgi:hypothetical protein
MLLVRFGLSALTLQDLGSLHMFSPADVALRTLWLSEKSGSAPALAGRIGNKSCYRAVSGAGAAG